MKLGKIILLVAILALVLRLPGLGSFMIVDEANWMERSADFYNQILRGHPAGTFVTTHPGSTVMWLVGGGVTIQEYLLGFDLDESVIRQFRRPATLPVALVSALLIALVAWQVGGLFSREAAIAAGVLLASDVYLIGSSQIAHLDALQALLMLGSLLSLLVYIKNRQLKHLIVAGGTWGLAMGVKLVLALWLLPVFAVILLVMRERNKERTWQFYVRTLGLVIGVASLVFYATWPALWVKDDLSRSIIRDVATIVSDEHVALAASAEPIVPSTFYVRTLLGRVPPHVQIMVLGALVVVLRVWRQQRSVLPVWWLIVYAVGFLLLITLAAKKADRYALPALVVWPVVAGWATALAWQNLRSRFSITPMVRRGLPVLLALAVVSLAWLWSPHAIAYNNPWLKNIRPLSQQGWGEGLEEAASWLNEHPLAGRMVVASWYPKVMSTYFVGETFSLSARDDERVAYLVTYRNMGGRARDTIASNVLDEVKGEEPVHTVYIQGVPYVWIYERIGVKYFDKHIGELIGNMEVGQLVSPQTDNWQRIDIGFATFSSRDNTEDIILNIRESVDSRYNLRTVRVNASEIIDNEWHTFTFKPITESAGKEFYVAITSPTSTAGNAVTVRYVDEDVLPGQMVLRRRSLRSDELNSGFFRTGDVAYRLP